MRDIFDEAIGVSPPTRIDLDVVIARRRQRTRLRWASGAGVTTAVVAVAVAAGLSGGGTVTRPSGGPSAVLMPEPLVFPESPVPIRAPETAQQTTQRIAATVTARLAALLPGVQLADRRTKAPGVWVYPRGVEPGGYLASLRVTTDAGSGTFKLVSAPRPRSSPSPSPSLVGPVIQRPDPPVTCGDFWVGSQTAPSNPDDRQCSMRIGPDGQTVLSMMDRLDADAVRYEVVALWADAYVDLTLENYFEGWENEGDPPDLTYLPSPQLTREQAGSLAQDPDLAP